MTSWSILGHTAKVLEERRDDYGDPAEQFRAMGLPSRTNPDCRALGGG